MLEEIKPTRKHAVKIFEWCVKEYGKSKFNKVLPAIEFRKENYLTEGFFGFYDSDDATIYINKDMNHDIPELVNSIIHEYTHYKQNMTHYQILSLYLSDEQNPLEIEAHEIADRDTQKCLKELFPDLNL